MYTKRALQGNQRGLTPYHFSKWESDKGFTLLLAALVASVVLALGASIFAIAKKQVTLSSIGRESQFAFYAADSAAECALYWDLRYGWFPVDPTPSAIEDVKCREAESSVTIDTDSTGETWNSTVFSYGFDTQGHCAKVRITKSLQNNSMRTVIHADGYNVLCNDIGTNPRALQRSVELHY